MKRFKKTGYHTIISSGQPICLFFFNSCEQQLCAL